MEALLTALLIVGIYLAVALLFGSINEGLRKSTGKGLFGWLGAFLIIGICLGIGYVWFSVVGWAIEDENVLVLVLCFTVGLIPVLYAGMMAWGAWSSTDSDGHYNPMSGKRAHYNKDGKLIGYSDKD